MINVHESYVAKLGFEFAISESAGRHITNYNMEPCYTNCSGLLE